MISRPKNKKIFLREEAFNFINLFIISQSQPTRTRTNQFHNLPIISQAKLSTIQTYPQANPCIRKLSTAKSFPHIHISTTKKVIHNHFFLVIHRTYPQSYPHIHKIRDLSTETYPQFSYPQLHVHSQFSYPQLQDLSTYPQRYPQLHYRVIHKQLLHVQYFTSTWYTSNTCTRHALGRTTRHTTTIMTPYTARLSTIPDTIMLTTSHDHRQHHISMLKTSQGQDFRTSQVNQMKTIKVSNTNRHKDFKTCLHFTISLFNTSQATGYFQANTYETLLTISQGWHINITRTLWTTSHTLYAEIVIHFTIRINTRLHTRNTVTATIVAG